MTIKTQEKQADADIVKKTSKAIAIPLALAIAFNTTNTKQAEACEFVCIGVILGLGLVGGAALTSNNQPQTKKTTPPPTPTPPQRLKWQLNGKERETRSRSPEVIIVPKDVPVQIGSESQTSEEIGFSIGNAEAASVGINLGPIHGQLQKSWDRSREGKVEQSDTRTINLTLNWDICNAWRLDYYKTVIDGELTAPQYGAHKPLPFNITTSQRIEPTKLCEDNTNITPPEIIKLEKEKISSEYGTILPRFGIAE